MVTELVDIGKISSRGQIAIPSEMRKQLGLTDGTKVLFIVAGDSLMLKKVHSKTFSEITKPLRDAKKKIKEKDVPALVHEIRKNIRENRN